MISILALLVIVPLAVFFGFSLAAVIVMCKEEKHHDKR